MGITQHFIGPMAKPHRMALVTVACVLSVFEDYLGFHGQIVAIALAVTVVGMVVTCARRTMRIVADLKTR